MYVCVEGREERRANEGEEERERECVCVFSGEGGGRNVYNLGINFVAPALDTGWILFVQGSFRFGTCSVSQQPTRGLVSLTVFTSRNPL